MNVAAPGRAAAGPARGCGSIRRERFPLGQTALLLAVFSAASINVSAHLAGRPLPGIRTFARRLRWWRSIFFFQLRACDEIKDREDDRRYRPERPIPRGLVSLRLIVGLALAGVPSRRSR